MASAISMATPARAFVSAPAVRARSAAVPCAPRKISLRPANALRMPKARFSAMAQPRMTKRAAVCAASSDEGVQAPTCTPAQAMFMAVGHYLQAACKAVYHFLTVPAPDGTGLAQRFKVRMMVAPLFASVGMTSSAKLISQAVGSFLKLYLLLLFLRVLLTWFPNVNWMSQPWITLRQVTDPYLNLFRNLIPPIMGQIDMTPLLGFLVLQFLANVLGTDDII
uniref:Fanciful K+ uptake-b family transporter n=1 Tax=Pyramimonas obovata TaxID=1411642 RepID=A0A7S0WT46_9CHLO|mmetsp:Transcript_38809/g.84469  ORF Transcript_38809/g.84469 Transcript_38809/m.84469 type:complete len:222 (+) Transcript_38809:33-698(+)|eukprot:CAMPEP_0118932036 /NCGR_PEP_ID=MMETSP1169-20130426/8952_1 /TAXON_ID=36882 /ORGANISM="Pyramimonas obovata, Strain CCMP722" /LENGTH=221 /DNA_ID=CAMNT_0006874625 /DNA_START=36 /DNA_END=701 /DNA_ORIENTATION=+